MSIKKIYKNALLCLYTFALCTFTQMRYYCNQIKGREFSRPNEREYGNDSKRGIERFNIKNELRTVSAVYRSNAACAIRRSCRS